MAGSLTPTVDPHALSATPAPHSSRKTPFTYSNKPAGWATMTYEQRNAISAAQLGPEYVEAYVNRGNCCSPTLGDYVQGALGAPSWWWHTLKNQGAQQVDDYIAATGRIPSGLDLLNVSINPAYRALDKCSGQVTRRDTLECAFAVAETVGAAVSIEQAGARIVRVTISSTSSASAPQTVLSAPRVGSTKLQNIVDDLYKGTTNPGRVGTGTTADAIRYELRTGQQVFGRSHIQKGEDYIRGLENWLKANPSAPYSERLIARSLADDLLDALGGTP